MEKIFVVKLFDEIFGLYASKEAAEKGIKKYINFVDEENNKENDDAYRIDIDERDFITLEYKVEY